MRRNHSAHGACRRWALFGLAAALFWGACGGDDRDEGAPVADADEKASFETAWPGADGDRRPGEPGGLAGAGTNQAAAADAEQGGDFSGGDGDGDGDGDDGGAQAVRAIQEADIIQLHGDRLYALSRMSGFNVIDVGDPTDLQLLGAFRDTRDAEPFEMYVQDGVAIVMFSGWGQYAFVEGEGDGDGDGEGGYAWVSSSEVLALDVTDAGEIEVLGSFDVPGTINDSRIVGDVLYIVAHQDGYCWNCAEDGARTVVMSLDVSDPRAIEMADELAFADDDNEWGSGRRSVTVTGERMYVGGPEYGERGPVGSTIQIIDITDPEGELVMGASVEARGEISSRWQMDEYDGVLRVISQPPSWQLTDPPRIQTFSVVSSNEVTALGSADMVLPRPEQLRAVRFDGPRAYAITFERTDPFFTIDLSDPAAPRQVGELEIPGFVYHMETRGDRVIGLGFDQGNAQGAITVSLFDVSDFDNPTMLSRVNFGGRWGYLPEDQDRIHKVFRVLDNDGLILAPFSSEGGFEDDFEGEFCRPHAGESQVQLIDFDRETLTARDALDTRGQARRALLLEEHVLTVTDQEVAAYDVRDRDAARRTDGLLLARNVERAVALSGGRVARLSRAWWAEEVTLDVVASEDAEEPSSDSELVVSGLFSEGDTCEGYAWIEEMLADGDEITLLYQRERATQRGDYREVSGVVVVDASDATDLRVAGQYEWASGDGWRRRGGGYAHGIPVHDASVARFDGGVAMIEGAWEYDGGDGEQLGYRLRVVDLRDPADPATELVSLDTGDGSSGGVYGLLAQGTTLSTSHHEPVAGVAGVTRFYLDRFDVSDPSLPEALPKVNVPGVVVHHDPASGYAIAVDLARNEIGDLTWEECAARGPIFEFEYPEWEGDPGEEEWEEATGPCVTFSQVVRLVDLDGDLATLADSLELDEGEPLRRLAAGQDLMVGTVGAHRFYGGLRGLPDVAVLPGRVRLGDCLGPCGGFIAEPENPEQLIVLYGLADGQLRRSTLELDLDADPWHGWWGATSLIASGDRAVVTGRGELAVIDLSRPQEPEVSRTEPFSGYANHTSVHDDRVVLSLG
ncbi:MAG: beta-propeller domain-containing protein, partial [Myxococcales bacterium]|nr:beta-propeller domain-containing protein [Myxococcales bacterium]